MSEPQFTPGPWSYEEHELSTGYSCIVYDANGHAIADHLREPEARLIAAAPSLYEGLDKAIARLETIRVRLCRLSAHDGTAKAELVDYIRQCEAEAEALLSKARGEA